MKYYIIAGEKSGDLHASNLMKEILLEDPDAQFRYFGGNLMKAVGGTLVKHYNEMAFMGFLEVLLNVNKIFKNLTHCKEDIRNYKPDVVILVDYAGFNLKIAEFAHGLKIKTFYYISPKLWAWNEKRVYKIKKFVDRMFVILPFEEAFYNKFNYKVDFVGNPVMDAVKNHAIDYNFKKNNNLEEKPIIAILPGSRKQEIRASLDKMVDLVKHFPGFNFVVAGVNDFPSDFYCTDNLTNLKVVYAKTYDVLAHSYGAIVTSGTATLETAMFKIPQVVCYKTSTITYTIAKALIKVKYISLVNLLANREVVKELIQDDFNTTNLISELVLLTSDEKYRQAQIEEYNKIDKELSKHKASERVAKLMAGYLKA